LFSPDPWYVGFSSPGEPELVKELPAGYHHATLTPDGKTMYLQGPLDKGRWGLFRSARGADGWGKPEALDELNSADGPTGDRSPGLSRDGAWLYFASARPGGKGGAGPVRRGDRGAEEEIGSRSQAECE
jgi:hypothetical protein